MTGTSDWLVGGGEMGALIRSMDWSRTPLGPLHSWSQSLRTAAGLCLASNFPICLVWGPRHIQLYNDGYRVVCGSAHPRTMGQDFTEAWASAWPSIGAAFERALAGDTSFLENVRMFLERNGYLEETFFTFSFSPIRDETGEVGGLFHPVTETTDAMLAQRRTRALRDLAARAGEARSMDAAFAGAVEVLKAREFDLPFTSLYQLDAGSETAHLVGSTGPTPAAPVTPEKLNLADPDPCWPLAEVLRSGTIVEISGAQAWDPSRCGPWPDSPYPEPPTRTLLLPLASPGSDRPAGVLVAGVSPRLPFTDAYRGFIEQVASAVSAAVASARAYEDERRRAEALAELDRAKTTFFSNVSHEFRTPLTLMLGPLEDLLRQQDVMPAGAREELDLVHRNALRLLRLVNTLLDFSRLEAGRVEAVYEPTDLAAHTADLASAFRSAAERAGLAFVVDTAPLPEPIYVDREMWEKIVLNLLSNAVKHTFEGEIRISLRLAGPTVELEVRDTGVGIVAEELPHLFERFHRVANALSRTHEGTGIGLALVRDLARLHGGEVRVASAPNQGSSFTVTLPRGTAHLPPDRIGGARTIASTATGALPFVAEMLRWIPDPSDGGATPAGHGPEPSAQRGGRILLADDNADMRTYVERLLRPYWTVESTADGRSALASALTNRPDLVISDVMMPGLTGFELLAALRADPTTRDLPVILLSARAGEEARVEGLNAGADDYLVKPFGARELIARVGAQLTLTRLRQEHAEHERALQVQAESLQEQDQFLRLSVDLLCIMDLDGRFTRTNPAFGHVLGYTEAELVGRSFLDFVHADDRQSAVGIFERIRRGDTVRDIEHRYRARDGYRMLSWNVVPAPDGLHVYATARDQTDAYRREQELRESDARMQFAVKAAQLGLWELDLATGMAWHSAQHDRIFGYDPPLPSWTYERLLEHVLPEDRQAVTEKYRHALERGTDWEFECRITRSDDRVRWIWARGVHVRDSGGATTGRMVGGVRDITDRRVAEERLRRLERMEAVGRLAGGVAHEANNMMSVVLGSAEFILERDDIPEEVRTDATHSRDAAVRTAAICAQLLAFSRRQVTRRETIDLNTVVATLEPILRRSVGDEIAVEWLPAERLAPVSADRGQLEQALLNLTLNARDAMHEGGTLSLEAANVTLTAEEIPIEAGGRSRPGVYAVLRIKDTGAGMSPETLTHCFEPFYTTKETGKGTGLGLSTVHGIVLQHDGFVQVASQLGRGTTFSIYLPATTEPVEPPAVPRPPEPGCSGTVLVVEDEVSVRGVAVRALARAGYAVLEVVDAKSAIALLRERREPVDLVLTDVLMPGMGGWALAAHLAAERPETQVILMSGDSGHSAGPDSATGSAAFVQKPFSPLSLIAAVRKVLAPSGQAGEGRGHNATAVRLPATPVVPPPAAQAHPRPRRDGRH